MMMKLLNEWRTNPIITTIESAALPVSKIPFPTVTVCPIKAEVDNWAMVEKVSNFFKFECLDVEKNNPLEPYCNETTLLREDFGPFFEYLVDMFEQTWQKTPMAQDEAKLHDHMKAQYIQDSDVEYMQRVLASGVNETDLKSFMVENVGVLGNVRTKLRSWFGETNSDETLDESTKQMAEVWTSKIFQFFFQSRPVLGLYFANIAPFLKGKTFKKSLSYTQKFLSFSCSEISELEKKIHGLFSDLSQSIGFKIPSFYTAKVSFVVEDRYPKRMLCP